MMTKGVVHLVGGGPGDPELLTVKGKRLIESADVIVYDALIDKSLLDLNPKAEHIDAGKRGGDHKMSQDDINALLCRLAEQGRNVVRLKGGDPFLFGRGAEEAEALKMAGQEVHVVPGISSAISVPEICGIPVTHREHASMVTFVTGHERSDRESDRLDWAKLAQIGGTIVVLMGMSNIPRIADALMGGGLPPSTPTAVMVDGSTERQRVLRTTINDVAEDVEVNGLRAPGIIVIGGCVSTMDKLGDLR